MNLPPLRALLAPAPDPLELLERDVRDLEDRVPQVNEGLALLRAEAHLQERELAALRARGTELGAKQDEARARGRDDVALNYAAARRQLEGSVVHAEARLRRAQEAFARGQEAKRVFLARKERALDRLRAGSQARRAIEGDRRLLATLAACTPSGAALAPHVELAAAAAASRARVEATFADLEARSAADREALAQAARDEVAALEAKLTEARARLAELERRLGP